MGKYFTRFKEIIGLGKKRQDRQDLFKKYQKPITTSSQQGYGRNIYTQLNTNFKNFGYDAKITKDGDLRVGKDIYHVKTD